MSNIKWYLLDDNNIPYEETDLIKVNNFFESPKRITKQEYPIPNNETVSVSTVFLALDHNISFNNEKDKLPILWETMVFGGEFDGYQKRYTSHKDALKGHKLIVSKIKRNAQATN